MTHGNILHPSKATYDQTFLSPEAGLGVPLPSTAFVLLSCNRTMPVDTLEPKMPESSNQGAKKSGLKVKL